MKKVAAATRRVTATPKTHPDYHALRTVLSILESPAAATSDKHGSLSDIASDVSRIAPISSALTAQKLTPREYAKFLVVVVQAYMVQQVNSVVPELGDVASPTFGEPSPANLTFVKANKSAVEALFEKIAAFTE